MQQQSVGVQRNPKPCPHQESNRNRSTTARVRESMIMMMMVQPCPFGMSQARPPGCSLSIATTSPAHVPLAEPKITIHPHRLRRLNPQSHGHHQQDREPTMSLEEGSWQDCTTIPPSFSDIGMNATISSDFGRICLEQSLRTDGWFSRGQIKGISEVRELEKHRSQGMTISKSCIDQENQKSGEINRGETCIEHEKHKSSDEAGNQEQGINGGKPYDVHRKQEQACSNSGYLDRGEPPWQTCNSTLKSETQPGDRCDWGMLSMKDALHALDQRVEVPFITDFLHIVQNCRKEKNLAFADHVHAHICKNGLETDIAVGNHIVPMFVECGSVYIAQQVFNRLGHRNEHSWSSLLLGYSQNGHLQHALNLYQDMQQDNVHPTSYTLVGLLKACARLKDVERGRQIHVEIRQKGFGEDVLVGNTLVGMYAKCGLLSEAQEAFEKLPAQNVVSWTALIAGYAEQELGQEALDCFNIMQLEGVSANAVTIACALKACSSIGAIDKGREIHTEAMEKGFTSDLTVSNSLVSMYAKCGSLNEAQEVFDKLQVRDVVSWNALIVGYAEHGPIQDALECFKLMQLEEVSPDAVTFSSTLKACGSTGVIEKGQEIHVRSAQVGIEKDLSVGNSLIGMYARCGSLSEARGVFDKLQFRDVLSWTALIAGYAEHGPGDEALKCFQQMQVDGIFPNTVTFACALKACGIIGAIDKGQELHVEVTQKGLHLELTVGNTLVGMYANCGLFSEALEVFEKLPARNVVSWTALIAGYAEYGSGLEALEYFDQMHLEGVSSNAVTFSCILKACGSIGAIDKGRETHTLIAWDGFESDSSVGNGLINMYAKCGSLLEAREVFDRMPVHDVVAWSSMIKGYAMNHEGNMALQCFEDMQQQGVKPDTVTFTCLLTACSHAGLIFKGQEYFKMVREEYGVAPTREHYSCMVDLLARSGHLYEAEKMLETLAPLSEDTWASLLSACKTHGEVELGLRCFQQLVLIDPEDAAWYVLMADIFAGAGRWEDAYMIEKLRKHAKAKKKRASALIEVNKNVHEFVVGNDQSKEVLAMLKNLTSRMKEEGHVPNLNLVVKPIADDQKEAALCEHVEKLAIAFGLLNTPQGATLPLSKNLRMCNDCHNASKIISKIERREIILRDDCCIHHFKEGSCACGDMF